MQNFESFTFVRKDILTINTKLQMHYMLYIFSFDRSGKNSTTPFVWSKHSLKKYFRCHICSKRNPPMYIQNSFLCWVKRWRCGKLSLFPSPAGFKSQRRKSFVLHPNFSIAQYIFDTIIMTVVEEVFLTIFAHKSK